MSVFGVFCEDFGMLNFEKNLKPCFTAERGYHMYIYIYVCDMHVCMCTTYASISVMYGGIRTYAYLGVGMIKDASDS